MGYVTHPDMRNGVLDQNYLFEKFENLPVKPPHPVG